MTREDAIKLLDILPLCNECNKVSFPYSCVECGDAFLLAIEALKQPEIVRCKDCKFGLCINPNCDYENRFIECMKYPIANLRITHKPDWFCADGVKIE